MAKKWNENSAIRSAIRRAFSRSPIVREVLQAGRREVHKFNKNGQRSKKNAVQYCCEVCGSWVSSTQIQVDHINPVVDPATGFIDWNTYVERLCFNDKSNLQRACRPCHKQKTNAENVQRRIQKTK